MILGIGVDIVNISRIQKSVCSDAFVNRIYTGREVAYCQTQKFNGENYAARYAAKEAFFKALGTGWRGELKFNEVEVINDELGKPDLVLHGESKKIADKMGVTSIHLSLSHTKEVAIAYLILE